MSRDSAQSIIGTCKVDLFDVPRIARDSGRAGSLAIPLIKALRETVALFNPVVYLISGFRWSFFGVSEVGIVVSLTFSTALVFASPLVPLFRTPSEWR